MNTTPTPPPAAPATTAMEMSAFKGYSISPRYARVTIWEFNAETHALIAKHQCTPLNHFEREQRWKIICDRLNEEGITSPPYEEDTP